MKTRKLTVEAQVKYFEVDANGNDMLDHMPVVSDHVQKAIERTFEMTDFKIKLNPPEEI